jgi:inosose dehydratase
MNLMLNRREFSGALAAQMLGLGKSRLAVAGYVYQQQLNWQKKPLTVEAIDDFLHDVQLAGFKNVELMDVFCSESLVGATRAALTRFNLKMPTAYAGGVMHEAAEAEKSIQRIVAAAERLKKAGARAIIHNPNPKPKKAPKTEAELKTQAEAVNRLARELGPKGLELRLHHHDPEMMENAREFRHLLANVDPRVSLCLDLDWVRQGGQDIFAILKESGKRISELHVRNSVGKVWSEDLNDGDIDYRAVAAWLKQEKIEPLIVVELAYQQETRVTRPLRENLKRSRDYAAAVFDVS